MSIIKKSNNQDYQKSRNPEIQITRNLKTIILILLKLYKLTQLRIIFNR